MKKILYALMALVVTTSTFAQVDRSQPKPGPAPKINLGKPQSFKLDNGLTVLVVENHKLPKVTASLTIDIPPYSEGDKVGINSITSQMMGNGTSKMSKEKYLEEIEFYGASSSIGVSGGYVSSLKKDFPKILDLTVQGAMDPLFTQEELDKLRDQMIESLKADEKSVTSIAGRVQDVLVYGKNHPYGEYTTEESLKNITLNDVKAHYKKYFSPNNAYLVITGDITLKEAKKLVNKHFKNWKKGATVSYDYKDPNDVAKTEINFVDVPTASQTEISIKNLHKLRMADKDFFPVLLANFILGGGGEGYLFMNLRETNGWTYGAYSSISPTRYISDFTATASVRSTATDSAIVEFRKELHRIRTEKVSAEDLKNAKAKYIGNFVMQVEKPQTVASYALNTLLHKLPENFYQNYITNIEAVTAEDIQRVANKYFSLDNSRIVVVGKAADVLEGLEKLNIPINYFDKYGNPTEKPQQKTIDPSITSQVVIDRYINAIGGKENLNKANSIVNVFKGDIQGTPLTLTQKKTNKGQLLVSMNAMGMELMKQVVTPKFGYMTQQGQRADLTGDELKEAQAKAVLFEELTNAKNYTLEGIENFEGEDAYALKNGDTTSYYSTKTGLKLGDAQTVEAMGQTFTLSTVYGDYKEVKGIKLPHSVSIPLGPGMNADLKAESVQVNEGVSEADFK